MFRIFSLLALLCPLFLLSQNKTSFPLSGKVLSNTINLSPLPGADLALQLSKRRAVSGAEGSFHFEPVSFSDTLIVSLTGYRSRKVPVSAASPFLEILLDPLVTDLGEVVVSTGYHSLPKERATGSFVQIDNELLNRKTGSNILDRLDGVTSGLLFNRNRTPTANEAAIMIRGRSTLFASTEPLIVVDNFPFDGDINSLNPNDVESITVLKDAAASSIWGVRAGNGVIVITTKKGKAGTTKFSVNSSLTFGERPNLYYQPIADAPTYIGLESFLFSKGYYNSRINTPYQSLSAAVDIMARRRAGLITSVDSATAMSALADQDVRTQLNDQFYRPSLLQQYAVSLQGGSQKDLYYFSAGYDRNLLNTQYNSQERITLNWKNSHKLVRDKLDWLTHVMFNSGRSRTSTAAFLNNYPVYTSLIDASGGALPYYRDYRKSWIDTIGQGQLLDWNNRPLDELSLSNNETRTGELRLMTSLNWKISRGLEAIGSYEYQQGNTETQNLQSQQSYYTRDLINRYSQPDYIAKTAVRAIPLGDILDRATTAFHSHNARLQINYNRSFGLHEITVLIGTEAKDYGSESFASRLFGYNAGNHSDIVINPVTPVTSLPSGSLLRVSTNNAENSSTDRYVSVFANAGYTYQKKYLLTLSARKDESNLFGVDANQKGVPLWSAGAGWILSRERFFHAPFISYLKLRASYGYSGNLDKSTSAYTTAGTGLTSVFLQPTAFIANPPNPDLSWEKIAIMNFGVDFSLWHGTVSGSAEYFVKTGTNLIGNSEVASQTGISQFRQNIADTRTTGFDLMLSATPLKGNINWNIVFLYSNATDIVTNYKLKPSQVKRYVNSNNLNPMEGKPWSAIFAYPWAGLNANTGDPQGYVNGQLSTDFTRLTTPVSVTELKYLGAGRPTGFGSLRNTISFSRFSFSANITYELGFWYRHPSIFYGTAFTSLQASGGIVHNDYSLRWQKPGDELLTNVPSLVYPATTARDEFYQNSEVLIEKGDHIRLRDVQVSYELPVKFRAGSPVSSVRLYTYINNIAILWRANHSGIDPNAVTGTPAPRTMSIGINIGF